MGRPLCGRLPGDSLGGRGRPPLLTGSKGIVWGWPLWGGGSFLLGGGRGKRELHLLTSGGGRPRNGSVGKDSHPVSYFNRVGMG